MKNFNSELDSVMENFGLHKTVVRERFPRNLKLSEEFVESFKREFKAQTSPVFTENEDGVKEETRGARDPGKVLKEFQKALKFLI